MSCPGRRCGARGTPFLTLEVDVSSSSEAVCCPHCSHPLSAFRLPDNSGWQEEFHLACFNDQCPYYRRGWDLMWERYEVKASYRYRLDPATGVASPLAVWSPDAIKDRIIDGELTRDVESTGDHEGE